MTTHESNAAPPRRAALRGDEADAQVVALLERLAPELDVEPDPAFRMATRQRLVAMAAVRSPEPARPSGLRRLLAARASDLPAPRWRSRMTAGLAGAALTVTSLATLVALSTEARPGDALYALKRGTEQTQLALAGDSRGQVLLDLARNRLDELGELGDDAALAESTLATMDSQTSEGASWLTTRAVETGDTAQLDRLAGWTAEQSTLLGATQDDVPPAAADDVDASLALLAEVSARVDGLRAALGCWAGPATSGTDDLGPLPVACPVPPAPDVPGVDSPPVAPPAPGGP
ncbi:DUF5667 domain-containing protein, partial [Candidatus Blastococcus massiliensis]|uniref:DUF5667 domain-containing protein n=1 Tax=Candidatus Blastococcus massiliensis TaxID=1470358 RepID=UPI000687FDCC